jgi:4-carboxymuconolactone decarboxylase
VARLPATQGAGEISARILERRGGRLRPLDGMLLHSPQIADGWNSLLGAIRSRCTVADDVRELIIMRIAVLNRAAYEWGAHEAVALDAGLGQEQLAALQQPTASADAAFSPVQQRVLAYTDAMTTDIQVKDSVFDALRADFSDTELVEITATIAAYNMVSRFLVALDVALEVELDVELPATAEVGT